MHKRTKHKCDWAFRRSRTKWGIGANFICCPDSSHSGQGVPFFVSCVGREGSCTSPCSFLPTRSFCACCFTGRALAVQSGMQSLGSLRHDWCREYRLFSLSPTSGIWPTAYVAVKMRVRLGEESRENKPVPGSWLMLPLDRPDPSSAKPEWILVSSFSSGLLREKNPPLLQS